MATVYLADDLKHNRQVAVKVLRTELSAQLGLNRFLKEIEVTAKLQHPHILPLFDSGEVDGVLFYVRPFVNGETLREKIDRDGELPIAEAVRLLRDVVDALSHAHAHGVVHRDIKPGNVLLAGRHAMVADFGIAKAVTEAAGSEVRTTLGAAVGTPIYMAPEQALAQPLVDHRADIYALGAMAYEMLTGSPPFTGPTPVAVLFRHVSVAPEPVRAHREAIPAHLGHVVMKCLEKNPADRWQTADEVLQQLDALGAPRQRVEQSWSKAPLTMIGPSRVFRHTRSIVAVALLMLAVSGWLAVNRFVASNATPSQPGKEARTLQPELAARDPVDIDRPSGGNPIAFPAGKATEISPSNLAARKPAEIDRPGGRTPTSPTGKEVEASKPTPAAPSAEDLASLFSLLSEFSHAIEARDTLKMRIVYPSMSDTQKTGWMQFFDAMKTVRTPMTMHGLVVYGDTARASAAGSYYYSDSNGSRFIHPITFDVAFVRGGPYGWTIRSMR
jgi:serine/threonine protein kinase